MTKICLWICAYFCGVSSSPICHLLLTLKTFFSAREILQVQMLRMLVVLAVTMLEERGWFFSFNN